MENKYRLDRHIKNFILNNGATYDKIKKDLSHKQKRSFMKAVIHGVIEICDNYDNFKPKENNND